MDSGIGSHRGAEHAGDSNEFEELESVDWWNKQNARLLLVVSQLGWRFVEIRFPSSLDVVGELVRSGEWQPLVYGLMFTSTTYAAALRMTIHIQGTGPVGNDGPRLPTRIRPVSKRERVFEPKCRVLMFWESHEPAKDTGLIGLIGLSGALFRSSSEARGERSLNPKAPRYPGMLEPPTGAGPVAPTMPSHQSHGELRSTHPTRESS